MAMLYTNCLVLVSRRAHGSMYNTMLHLCSALRNQLLSDLSFVTRWFMYYMCMHEKRGGSDFVLWKLYAMYRYCLQQPRRHLVDIVATSIWHDCKWLLARPPTPLNIGENVFSMAFERLGLVSPQQLLGCFLETNTRKNERTTGVRFKPIYSEHLRNRLLPFLVLVDGIPHYSYTFPGSNKQECINIVAMRVGVKEDEKKWTELPIPVLHKRRELYTVYSQKSLNRYWRSINEMTRKVSLYRHIIRVTKDGVSFDVFVSLYTGMIKLCDSDDRPGHRELVLAWKAYLHDKSILVEHLLRDNDSIDDEYRQLNAPFVNVLDVLNGICEEDDMY